MISLISLILLDFSVAQLLTHCILSWFHCSASTLPCLQDWPKGPNIEGATDGFFLPTLYRFQFREQSWSQSVNFCYFQGNKNLGAFKNITRSIFYGFSFRIWMFPEFLPRGDVHRKVTFRLRSDTRRPLSFVKGKSIHHAEEL